VARNEHAGEYAACRQRAVAEFAVNGNETARAKALQKCSAKFAKAWSRLEARAPRKNGHCPSVADEAAIEHAIDLYTTKVSRALDGGVLANGPLPKTGPTRRTGVHRRMQSTKPVDM
jgi:hypothetical protein